jgi:hypothetical protein
LFVALALLLLGASLGSTHQAAVEVDWSGRKSVGWIDVAECLSCCWTDLWEKSIFFHLADRLKLNVLVDISQYIHSADYQGICGPREVGREE